MGRLNTLLEPLRGPFLIAAIAILLLGAMVTAFLYWKGRRPPPQEVKEEIEPPPPPPSPMTTVRPEPPIPYLESLGRPAGTVFCTLDRSVTTIGRADDGDDRLVIDKHFVGWPTVSRTHAQIELDGERFVVVDQNSMNGVYINGQRTGENVLYDGCTVSFGQVQFVFRMNRGGGAK